MLGGGRREQREGEDREAWGVEGGESRGREKIGRHGGWREKIGRHGGWREERAEGGRR